GSRLKTFTGASVHDLCKSQRTYARVHGLCNAHVLRELTQVKNKQDRASRLDVSVAVGEEK
ncbi:MAG: transposase, partial [Bacteroidales bacterium]|nr:transposase [Bacteroidales bacterium]